MWWLVDLKYSWFTLIKPSVCIVCFTYCERVVISLYDALSSSWWMLYALVICGWYYNIIMHLRTTQQSIEGSVDVNVKYYAS